MKITYKIRKGGTTDSQIVIGFDSLINLLADLVAANTFIVSINNKSDFSIVGTPQSISETLTNIVNDAFSFEQNKLPHMEKCRNQSLLYDSKEDN